MGIRQLLCAGVCAAFVVGGTAVIAGEVTGNGKITPIKNPRVANSNCAFSGLEDGTVQPDDVVPGVVQNFGNHGSVGVSDNPGDNNPSNFEGRAAPGTSGPGGCNPS